MLVRVGDSAHAVPPKRGAAPARAPASPLGLRPHPPCPKAVTVSACAQTPPAPWSHNNCPVKSSIRAGVSLSLPVWAWLAKPSLFVRPKCRIGRNPLPSFRQTPPTPPPESSTLALSNRRFGTAALRLALRGKWELLRITVHLTLKTSNLTPRLQRIVSFHFTRRDSVSQPEQREAEHRDGERSDPPIKRSA